MLANKVKNSLSFMAKFANSPKCIGALLPSSNILCTYMIAGAAFKKVSLVAELGAGTGVLTHQLLKLLHDNTQLDIYEIQPSFIDQLNKIDDDRLTVKNISAEFLSGSYDVIFSSLPLLSLPLAQCDAILEKVAETLAPGGVFIQFQYTTLLEKKLARHFSWRRRFVLFNLPPAFVYQCQHHCLPAPPADNHLPDASPPRPSGFSQRPREHPHD